MFLETISYYYIFIYCKIHHEKERQNRYLLLFIVYVNIYTDNFP